MKKEDKENGEQEDNINKEDEKTVNNGRNSKEKSINYSDRWEINELGGWEGWREVGRLDIKFKLK